VLTIRQTQMDAFERHAAETFENHMVAHVRTFAAAHARVLGGSGVRHVVRLGMAHASRYGLTDGRSVRLYIELMFLFGSEFTTDPQLPWARDVLSAAGRLGGPATADRLRGKAMTFLDFVSGPDDEYEKAACARALRMRFEDLPSAAADLDEQVVRALRQLHPEKCACVGEPALLALLTRAADAARVHRLEQPQDIALLTGLMFTFGHGCTSDLQYPWIGATLASEPSSDRTRRLFAKLMTYLRASLSSVN
jgi:hypothetical protein